MGFPRLFFFFLLIDVGQLAERAGKNKQAQWKNVLGKVFRV